MTAGSGCANLRRRSARTACVCVAALAWPALAMAASTYYVDPTWTGAATGAAATPWTSLTPAAWSTINTALASGDVIVYFSARAAGSATNEVTTTPLAVSRTNASANHLTLDGMSMYNTNDAAPAWTANTGTNRFQITASVPVSTGYVASSGTSVKGFRLIATAGQIIFWYGGNNVTWEDNEGSSSVSNTWGPGFYFGYTQHEGDTTCPTARSTESCVAFTNLTIQRNYIHDTFGEAIYIGGCANNVGCLSHDGVTIANNKIRNVAVYGGEPDAIDLKDGLRHLVVRGNDVRLQRDSRSGISTESGAIVDSNYVESAGWAAIAFSAYWNKSGATRTGSVARNNILVNSGGNLTGLYGTRYGIYTDNSTGTGDLYTDLKIYSNTVYGVQGPAGVGGFGIGVFVYGTTLVDNIVVQAASYALYVNAGTLATHSNNLVYQPSTSTPAVFYGGVIYTNATVKTFEPTALNVDPQFVSAVAPYSPGNFEPQSTSPAVHAGVVIPTFSVDYFGTNRGSSWDIGAVQYVLGPPHAPSNLHIIR